MKYRNTAIALLLIVFIGFGVKNVQTNKNHLQLKEIQIQSTTTELKHLELKYRVLNQDLDKELHGKILNKNKVKELEKEKQELEQQLDKANRDLQAKREARIAASRLQRASERAFGGGTVYAASGDKNTWLRASGIPQSQWWAVDYIVSRESGWDPCSYNPGKSNCGLSAGEVNCSDGDCYYGGIACGLGQSLPCGKWGSNWTDPVKQLKAMHVYVNKFGGWGGAVAYWKANQHY